MWQIHLAFLFLIVCTMFLPFLTFCNTSFFTRSVQLIFSLLLQHHISKRSRYLWPTFRIIQVQHPAKLRSKCSISLVFFLKFQSSLLVKRVCSVGILDLISRVHLVTLAIRLPIYLKYPTFSSCFWSIIKLSGDSLSWDSHYLRYYHFISIP